MYVPFALTRSVPFDTSTTGTVLAVSAVVSGSESPASVKSPLNGVSSLTEIFSLSRIGGSLKGVTVTKIVSTEQIEASDELSSHTSTIKKSEPLKPGNGV